ncbi:MAG TPA: hypothetical protein VGZ23_00670 [bacterium]|nr:hypothetical protein [bacterium]
MFIHRVRGFPAPGKVPEFRATLEEWVKKRQGQGIDTSLARQLFAPDGATFVVTTRFHSLAEYEDQTRKMEADPAYQALVAKLAPLTRAMAKFELMEVLVPFSR